MDYEKPTDKADMLCFPSSFRHESAPNITHCTLDGVKTLCGRKVEDAATTEGWIHWGPDCLKCKLALDAYLRRAAKAYLNNWRVQCCGCGAEYVDHRRRVGSCLKCESPAIIVDKVTTAAGSP